MQNVENMQESEILQMFENRKQMSETWAFRKGFSGKRSTGPPGGNQVDGLVYRRPKVINLVAHTAVRTGVQMTCRDSFFLEK